MNEPSRCSQRECASRASHSEVRDLVRLYVPRQPIPHGLRTRLEALQAPPIGTQDLDGHVIALHEATRDEPLRQWSVFAPEPEHVADREPQPPMLPIEIR